MSWYDTGYEESLHQDPCDDPDPIEDDDVELDDIEPEELYNEEEQ
jgi:hypothetical protein